MWDSESKRIAICGDGRGRLIRAVMWDTGSDLGEFTGHSRGINSVDFRPCRPFRMVSSSDDMLVSFYQGPPFKFDHSDNHHKNFVHAVRYDLMPVPTLVTLLMETTSFLFLSTGKSTSLTERWVWRRWLMGRPESSSTLSQQKADTRRASMVSPGKRIASTSTLRLPMTPSRWRCGVCVRIVLGCGQRCLRKDSSHRRRQVAAVQPTGMFSFEGLVIASGLLRKHARVRVLQLRPELHRGRSFWLLHDRRSPGRCQHLPSRQERRLAADYRLRWACSGVEPGPRSRSGCGLEARLFILGPQGKLQRSCGGERCLCVHWLVGTERRVNGRDDTVRFTDLNSLQELASLKLDEQPISVFAAGSVSLVVCDQSLWR